MKTTSNQLESFLATTMTDEYRKSEKKSLKIRSEHLDGQSDEVLLLVLEDAALVGEPHVADQHALDDHTRTDVVEHVRRVALRAGEVAPRRELFVDSCALGPRPAISWIFSFLCFSIHFYV